MEKHLTHPNINNSVRDLGTRVREFLCDHLGMENRNIDANRKIKKSKRQNIVQINLSNTRFKKFFYAAKKKIRTDKPENHDNFYLNEYLTAYNFDILKGLKLERKRCSDENMTCFEAVYTYEGQVYIKKRRSNDKNDAICVNTKKLMERIINENKNSSVRIPEIVSDR